MNIQQQIVALIRQAQDLASKNGIPNILQPGLVKEMIIAELLGHQVIFSKRNADACDPVDNSILYEYLSCSEGGSGQLDRMFKAPPEKRVESLQRITRNKFIYLSIFFKNNPLTAKVIYQITPSVMLMEANKQLDKSGNDISHMGFNEKWAKENGIIVYEHKSL